MQYFKISCFIFITLIFLFPGTSKSQTLNFDQDRVGDLGVFQQGKFLISSSQAGIVERSCGAAGDLPFNGNLLSQALEQVGAFNLSYGLWQVCTSSSTDAFFWGEPGDIPVLGDYDGDGLQDAAVFRRSTSEWYILFNHFGAKAGKSDVIKFGLTTDIPVSADYDGDGKVDLAVFRQKPTGSASWLIKFSSSEKKINFGLLGDIPVPADYDGDGKTDLAVWRPNNGTWYLLLKSKTFFKQWGLPGDFPNPADYDGDGKADFLVFRPSEGTWFISTQANFVNQVKLGKSSDRVVGGLSALSFLRKAADDFDGDGFSELVLPRSKSNQTFEFLFHNGKNILPSIVFGKDKDLLAQADYDGDGVTDLASVRQENGVLNWQIRFSSFSQQVSTFSYGLIGDQILPGDYDGDLKTDLCVVRNTSGGSKMWLPNASGIKFLNPVLWGFSTDKALTADVDGDGRSDMIVVREVNNELLWLVRTAKGEALQPKFFGLKGDQFMVGDFNGDNKAELGVIRIQDGFKLVIVEGQQPFVWGMEGDQSFSGNFLASPGLEHVAWRVINGQGYSFIRDLYGNAITIPFGVIGDRLVNSSLVNFFESKTTTINNSSQNRTNKLNCASRSDVAQQESGFVFKPISDSDSKLVVVFGASLQGKIKKVALVQSTSDKDVVLETLRFVGNLNGGRPTFRANKPGRDYPQGVILVKQDQQDRLHCITVPDPSKRTE